MPLDAPPKFRWTAENVGRLKGIIGSSRSLSAEDIARELDGPTRNAVIGKLLRLHLPLPNAVDRNLPKPPQSPRVRREKRADKPFIFRHRSAAATRPPVPAPAIESIKIEETPFVEGCGITIIELKIRDCRFPQGDPREESFRYCGQPAAEGRSYCLGHARIAFQPVRERRGNA